MHAYYVPEDPGGCPTDPERLDAAHDRAAAEIARYCWPEVDAMLEEMAAIERAIDLWHRTQGGH